ncbi:MAG TPA: molybdenum cofactor biosynthesis protein MoaE [Gammaproteobacteria bacterium]|nr:molybdenum cofactor biosynthesis protein MoaE [Gammaproteobacteria bacterium]
MDAPAVDVRIVDTPFDPWASMAALAPPRGGNAASAGATAVFVGTMRDFNDGGPVSGMYLEHYPGMTERQLRRIVLDSCRRRGVQQALVVHRVGEIRPGETIVLVAARSGHRGEAFAACREILEQLKHEAPFWKKEILPDGGSRWVRSNTAADPALPAAEDNRA